MKQSLLILSVLCLQQVVFGDDAEASIPPEQRECLTELNVPASVLLASWNEDWTISEGNADVNNVMLCTFGKFHRLNEDKSLNLVKIKELFIGEIFKQTKMTFDNPEEIAANSIESCKDVQGSDAADTSVKIWNCIIKYLRNHENKV